MVPRLGLAAESRIPIPARRGVFHISWVQQLGVDSIASVTRLDSEGRQGYRIRFYVDDRRREIYLAGSGKRVERMADIVARHCDDLAKAKSNNVAPSADALAWAATVEGRVRENLVAWGLADPTSPS